MYKKGREIMQQKLLIIGAGRMAEAIISGLKKQSGPQHISITVSNFSNEERLNNIAEKYEVETTTDWLSCIEKVDVVIMAAPPQAHEQLLKSMAGCVNNQLIMTVAAGIDTTYMESFLPKGTPVSWLMPNTAALIQHSMTPYVCGRWVTDQHRPTIQAILNAIGDSVEVTEEQVHNLTAITGSAPAFLYLFCEALEEAALKYGVSQEQARLLVTNMVSGSANMLHTDHTFKELRDQVCTPGGSTEAGIKTLQENDFVNMMLKAVKSTNEHARTNASDK